MRNESYAEEGAFHIGYLLVLCTPMAALALALLVGDVEISVRELFEILIEGPFAERADAFKTYAVWGLRLPRAVCAGLAGAILCLCGALLRRSTGLAAMGPFVIGAAPSAVFGLFCLQLVHSRWLLPAPIIAGIGIPFIAWTITDNMTKWDYRAKLPLIGFLSGSLLLAATALLKTSPGLGFRDALELSRLIGSFRLSSWPNILPLLLSFCLLLLLCSTQGENLDALAKGFDIKARNRIIIVAVCCGSAAIAAAHFGALPLIGFVIPHLVDRCLPDWRHRSAPSSAALGATVLILLDTISRARGEIPVGSVILAFGLPLFIITIMEDA